jgi:hypothetical protein
LYEHHAIWAWATARPRIELSPIWVYVSVVSPPPDAVPSARVPRARAVFALPYSPVCDVDLAVTELAEAFRQRDALETIPSGDGVGFRAAP